MSDDQNQGDQNQGDQNQGDQNQGGQTLGWRDKLPEDIRSTPTLEKFKDETEMISMPINVARSYINAEQLIGRDKIPIPKTPEEWDATYKRLGKPDSAELYVLPIDESVDPKLKEHLGKDAEWFRAKAHELGLNEKQATALFSAFSGRTVENISNIQTSGETEKLNAEILLRSEFGPAYDGKMMLAGRALQELGGDELVKLVDATGIGNHPAFTKAFMKIGSMMAEDLGLDKNTGALMQSKESIQEQIVALQTSAEYTDASNPAHKIAVDKVAKLMQHLHGNTVVGGTLNIGR